MINRNILLSVNIITYNHEKYIRQAIEGALMQKTNFLYELVICDDFSTDSTRAILKEYQKKYPAMIRLRFRDRNLGLKDNYFDNIIACAGKYVAICEGDDYWLDDSKLQKQVDFLESNPAYSMCFHSAMEVHEYKDQPTASNIFSKLEERSYTGEEILSNWLIPTASVVFRKDSSFRFQFIDKLLFYDIALFLRLCESGRLFCMNQVMCVYRRHPNSITNSNLSYIKYIEHLKYINLEFSKKYDKIIKMAIAVEYIKQARYTFKHRSAFFLFHTIKSLFYDITPFSRMLSIKFGR